LPSRTACGPNPSRRRRSGRGWRAQKIEEPGRRLRRLARGPAPAHPGQTFSPSVGDRLLLVGGAGRVRIVLDGELVDDREHFIRFLGADGRNPEQIVAVQIDHVEERSISGGFQRRQCGRAQLELAEREVGGLELLAAPGAPPPKSAWSAPRSSHSRDPKRLISQPMSCDASRTFCPARPMASESWSSSTIAVITRFSSRR
jgi:hypothetical protein